MTIHSKTVDMLKESLSDMLKAAELCINFRKQKGGCLGYPAVAILLSIVDSIGSYYSGDSKFKIMVDGKPRIISSGYKHFYILNSIYYKLNLTDKFIKQIYDNYRSLLVHNLVIAKDHLITINDPLGRCFCENDGFKDEKTGKTFPSIHLIPLFNANRHAISVFLKEVDSIFPSSKQAINIQKR